MDIYTPAWTFRFRKLLCLKEGSKIRIITKGGGFAAACTRTAAHAARGAVVAGVRRGRVRRVRASWRINRAASE